MHTSMCPCVPPPPSSPTADTTARSARRGGIRHARGRSRPRTSRTNSTSGKWYLTTTPHFIKRCFALYQHSKDILFICLFFHSFFHSFVHFLFTNFHYFRSLFTRTNTKIMLCLHAHKRKYFDNHLNNTYFYFVIHFRLKVY